MEIFQQAGRLLWSLDEQLLSCVEVSLLCSLAATLAAVAVGVPLAVLLGRKQFPGRKTLLVLANTGMAVPTVIIGLVCYMLLSRSGPFGSAGLLYTRWGIIAGEFALALPMIVAMFSASAAALSPALEKTARTLGAGRSCVFIAILREAEGGLLAATMAAFGRIVSELGIAMMVGGNIRNSTRTMTTAIALETQKGEFAMGLALGLILLLIALGINAGMHVIRLPRKRSPGPAGGAN